MAAFQGLDTAMDAMRLVAQHFRRYLAAQGPFVVLGGVAAVGLSYVLVRRMFAALAPVLAGGEPSPEAMLDALRAAFVPPMLALVLTNLLTLVGVFFGMGLTAALPGTAPGPGALWARFGPRFGTWFLTAAVASLGPLLILLLPLLAMFYLPGSVYTAMLLVVVLAPLALLLFLRWWLAPPAALLGHDGVGACLAQSAALARGHLLHIALAVLFIGVANGVVVSILTAPVSLVYGPAFTGFAPEQAAAEVPLEGLVLQGLAGLLVALFFAPVHAAAALLAYQRRTAPAPAPAAPPPPAFGAPPDPAPAAPPAPAGALLAACRRCGAAAKPGASFCAVCGTSLRPPGQT